MTGASAGRDGQEVDALVTDRYLDGLLAAHARGADHAPTASEPSGVIRRTADRLARDLPRLHPSFLFEEALAARLADVAARMHLPAAAGAEGQIVPLPAGDLPMDLPDEESEDARTGYGRRPLIIGGALTSAALSLAFGIGDIWWRMRWPKSSCSRAAPTWTIR